MVAANLAARIAMQAQRIKAVHSADSQFTFALADYCAYLTGPTADPSKRPTPLQTAAGPDALSQPHMDPLQVLRDMMVLLEECYDNAGEGEQTQIYVEWVTDLIREKFTALTEDSSGSATGEGGAHAAAAEGGGDDYDDGGADGVDHGHTNYDDAITAAEDAFAPAPALPRIQVISAVSNYWFRELALYLRADPERGQLYSELEYLVGFALDPRESVQPPQQQQARTHARTHAQPPTHQSMRACMRDACNSLVSPPTQARAARARVRARVLSARMVAVGVGLGTA
jgi:hypothetical protein